MQSEQPLQGIKLQEKEDKNEKHIRKLIRKNPKITRVYNTRRKTIQNIGRLKAFSRQKTPENSCSMKETADIIIFIL